MLLLVPMLIFSNAFAKERQVLVLYPAVNTPFDAIYASTIKGIKTKVNQLTVIAIPEAARFADLQSTLDHHSPDNIIALGNQAIDLINQSPYRRQALAGLIYFNATDYQGVSLSLDSQVVVSLMRRLTPGIKRVFIVENKTPRFLKSALSEAVSKPLLVLREGADLLATMRILGQLLEQEAKPEDAILIPADIPKDILYEASKIAWRKNIMLLSTNLSHLEYGVMMAFYPNMVALGQQLGDMINKPSTTYETVKTVDVSLNQRVAQHLDIQFDSTTLSSFSIVLE